MGLILDTSVLIASERQQFELARFFAEHADEAFFIAATALHYDHGLVTLNTAEFRQVDGLSLAETAPYCR